MIVRTRRILLAALSLCSVALACTCNTSSLLQAPMATASRRPAEVPQVPTVVVPTLVSDEVLAEVDAQDAWLTNLYQRVSPSVVFIKVFEDTSGVLTMLGSGSGFVIDTEGHIVTNNHVVEQADSIQVTFSDGSVAPAELLGADPYSDLAVLRVDMPADRLFPVELGDSLALKVGQRVVAIGNPFGLQGTMTVGIISALARTLPAQVAESAGYFSNPEIIQTDAAINPGNSGGPLLDSRGRVVGVNAAIRSTTDANSGVGFAVPVNTVKRIVPQLIEEGVYHYPYLGIYSNNLFTLAELADVLDLPVMHGILVSEVTAGGPADRAGLRGGRREVEHMGARVIAGGDIITAINGYGLQNFDELIAYLVRETEAGQEVTLTIIRDGKEMQIPVTLGERP